MFASTYPAQSPRNAGGARLGGLYRQVGVETLVADATPHRLVAMLFEGFIEAVAQARGALVTNDMLGKGRAIGRAVRIVDEGLRAGLDLKSGGTLARDLDDLYHYLVLRLTLANLRSDDALLVECQQLIKPLQEAWTEIAGQPETR